MGDMVRSTGKNELDMIIHVLSAKSNHEEGVFSTVTDIHTYVDGQDNTGWTI
jgi:hypothetical protein